MLIDARSLPDGEHIETDVCIVGSGPAGATMARELANSNLRICVLESGGRADRPDAAPSDTMIESEDPRIAQQVTAARKRALGGAANLWDMTVGGRAERYAKFLPLEEADFEARHWVPNSGWPFDKAHLDPFYGRAQSICGLGPFDYDTSSYEDESHRRLPFAADSIETVVLQLGASEVFTRPVSYGEGVDNLTVLIHATLVGIEVDRTGRSLTRLQVTADGSSLSIRAGVTVLAAGGIENPRLLLSSTSAHPAGSGNEGDATGRFFMEHPAVRLGVLVPDDPDMFGEVGLYDRRLTVTGPVVGQLTVAPEARRSEGILGMRMALRPRSKLRLHERLLGRRPFGLRRGGGRPPSGRRGAQDFVVLGEVEQAPDADNRVTLGPGRDLLGQPRARLAWRWGDLEWKSIRRTQELLEAEVLRAGLGRFHPRDHGGDDVPLNGAHHHMGTTRMSRDPRDGVVDEHCQVHGAPNLFVAGSSVFPTAGQANPTLTIVALAIRLADRIKALT